MTRKKFASIFNLSLLLILLAGLTFPTQFSVYALTTLSVEPLTWNVIGLDSNNVSVGPNHFPIGARVCNTGAEDATNVTATWNWDTVDAYIDIRPGTLTTINLGTLTPGSCVDAYFEVEVDRDANAYDHTREYHIEVTAGNVTGTISTPQPRELYVEYLVSQSRNGITNVEFGTSLASMTSVAAGGTMNLMVGNTYYIRMTGFTATQGYEQIEYFINIPNTIFQVLSVSSTFDADTSATVGPSPIDMLYGDNCIWENDPADPNYRACLSTGKTGGNIQVTYQVKILQVPGAPLVNPAPLSTLIYDFSGSSFHYNADYDVSTRFANIINASVEKSFSRKTILPGANSTLTFTINNPGAATITDVNFTDDLPANLNLANGNVGYSGCGTPSPTSGSLTDPMSFTNITVAGNSVCTIAVTVTSASSGIYNNTTGNLFIGTTDTGDNASDTLVVSSAPTPPNSCASRTTFATWTFENYSGLADAATDGGSFNASSDLLPITTPQGFYRSAGSSQSAIIDRDQAALPTGWTIPDPDNATTVWGIRQSWLNAAPATPFDPSTFTSPFFEFQVNTEGLYGGLGISMDYNLESANGWTNGGTWYVLYSTNGTTWSQPTTGGTPNGTGSWTKGDWYLPSTPNISAISNSTSTNVYFRLYFAGASSSQNQNANAYIDNVNITGCPNPTVPTISKAFATNPITVGGTSVLTFTLTNPNASALTGVSFTDVLPGGLTIHTTPGVTNSCGGTVTAVASTQAISLSGGTINGPANTTCSISVTVRGVSAGSYTNTSTNITSTETGPNTSTTMNVGFGQALLNVIAPPVIAKAFSANPIFTGETSLLTFTVNNPNPSIALTNLSFTDNLPAGLVVDTTTTTPAAAPTNTCGGTLTANDGAGVISLGGVNSLAAGATCTITVRVRGVTTGLKSNSVIIASTNGGTGNTDTADVLVKDRTPAINLLKQVGPTASGPWSPYLTVTTGDDVYYRFTVENVGDLALTVVSINDPTLSGEETCVWIDGDGTNLGVQPISLPTYDANDNQLATCVFGPISAVSGEITNTATATFTGATPADEPTSSATYATLTIDKDTSTPAITPNGTVIYTIVVANSGDQNLTNFQVTDTLPDFNGATAGNGYTVTSVTAPGFTVNFPGFDGSADTNLLAGTDTLSNNTTVAITITLDLTNAVAGTYDNTAVATTDQTGSIDDDGTSANDAGTPGSGADPENDEDVEIEVVDISLDKQVSNATPNVGSTVTFTLVVANDGPSTATNIDVTDVVPDGYAYVGSSITGGDTNDDTDPGTTGLTWTINSLASGASVNLTYQATVLATGTYDNYAEVNDHDQTDSDSTPGNGQQTPDEDDDDTQTVTPVPVIDISLDKQVSNATPNVGDTITFTLVIANAGPSAATNIDVTDLVPDGYTYVGSSITGGDTNDDTDPGTTGLTWTVNNLASGASVNLTYQATVLASGTYDNYAEVTDHDQTDSDSTPGNGQQAPDEDDDDTQTVTPSGTPGLTLNKTSSLDMTVFAPNTVANAGDQITYGFEATNTGNVTLTNVTVSDSLLGSLSCNTLATLAPGATTAFTCTNNVYTLLQADIDAGSRANTAEVSSTETCTGAADCTDTETVTLTAVPAINIVKSPATQNVLSGGTANFTLTVTNTGNVTLTNVVVTDAQCTTGPTFTGGDTNTDNQLQLTETWTYSCSVAGVTADFTNTASVNTAEGATDSDTADVTVVAQLVDLKLDKSVSNTTPLVATDITFTLTVTNLDPIDATNVVVTDVLPAGFVHDSDTSGGTYNNLTGVWNVGTVPAKSSVSIDITVTVNVTGPYTNYAEITGMTEVDPDSTPNNNSTDEDDDDSVTVTPTQNDPSGLSKSISSTNQAFTTNPNVAIGEIVEYTVNVTIPPGVFTNSQMVDTMERGLSFMGCASITPSDAGLTTNVAGSFAQACSTPTVDDAGGGTTVDVGRRVMFDLGTLTNASGADQTLTFVYNAVVLDSAANISGVVLDNSAAWTSDSGTLPPASTSVLIVEPDLTISKTANTSLVSVGSEITITLTIQHTGGSQTNAYNTVVTDVLPAELQFVPGSLNCTSGTQDPDLPCTESGGTITAEWSNFVLGGGNGQISFRVTVISLPASGISNVANVAWSSLPGDVSSPQNGNIFSTERDYDPASNVDIYGTSDTLVIGVFSSTPATGFAPNEVTDLGSVPSVVYKQTGGVTVEVPSLGISLPIVGVPLKNGEWDVSWLGNQAGWLDGTAFPSWSGNSVLTSHVYGADGLPGPFVNLNGLKYGDKILVHVYGQTYTYEVRSNAVVEPNDTSIFRHEEKAWITLVTCKEYDEATNTYRKRVLVRAVLVAVDRR